MYVLIEFNCAKLFAIVRLPRIVTLEFNVKFGLKTEPTKVPAAILA